MSYFDRRLCYGEKLTQDQTNLMLKISSAWEALNISLALNADIIEQYLFRGVAKGGGCWEGGGVRGGEPLSAQSQVVVGKLSSGQVSGSRSQRSFVKIL